MKIKVSSLPLYFLSLALLGAPLPSVADSSWTSICSASSNNGPAQEQNEREFSAIKHEIATSPTIAEKYIRKAVHAMVGDDAAAYLGISPEVSVLKLSQPAAFASSNRVIVSTGLLELADSASEVAFILAHEMGHLALHHRGSFFTGERDRMNRELINELDADQFAVHLMKDSGLDPRAGIAVLTRLSQLGNSHGLELGSLFPSIQGRIQSLERQLPK